jgi:hypothetical protein
MTGAACVRYDKRAAALDIGLFLRRTMPSDDKQERETGKMSIAVAP